MVQFRENTSIKFQLLSYFIDTVIVDKKLILYLRTENNECLSFASGYIYLQPIWHSILMNKNTKRYIFHTYVKNCP